MAELTDAERAFYEWWHGSTMTGDFMPKLREVFLAGWKAGRQDMGVSDD